MGRSSVRSKGPRAVYGGARVRPKRFIKLRKSHLSVRGALAVMQHKREAGGVKSAKGQGETNEISNAELLELERDVLVPAALE